MANVCALAHGSALPPYLHTHKPPPIDAYLVHQGCPWLEAWLWVQYHHGKLQLRGGVLREDGVRQHFQSKKLAPLLPTAA